MIATNLNGKQVETKPVIGEGRLICVFLALLVLAVFGQTGRFDFVNCDDGANVTGNPEVQHGWSIHAVGWAFTHPQACNWVPLTTMSHMMDCQLFGLAAGGPHLINVLLHAVNTILLFLVLRQMTGQSWSSAAVAALFAIHPLRAESVAWISERKDVLCGLFFLITINAYVRQVKTPSRLGFWAVSLVFTLALLAKSMAVTLPAVLLLLDYWPLHRLQSWSDLPKRAFEKIPLFVLAGLSGLTNLLTPGLVVNHLPVWGRIQNAVVCCVIYLGQTFFPAGLSPSYPIPPDGVPAWQVVSAFLGLAGISIVVVAGRQRRPFLFVGWLWYLVMLIPVLGLIQISDHAAHADRYTYLPGIGLAMAAVWFVAHGLGELKQRHILLTGAFAIILAALIVCTWIQTGFWRNSELLWTRALAIAPSDTFARNALGLALDQKGDLTGAIAQYRQALESSPRDPEAHLNLGVALDKRGESDAAVAEYRKVLEINPDSAPAQNNLGLVLLKTGKIEQAVAEFRGALAVMPGFAQARGNLGTALLAEGAVDEALSELKQSLDAEPDNAEALGHLGIAFYLKGDEKGAIGQYQKALQINPNDIDTRNNLGVAYFNQGDLENAIAQYRAALKIRPDYAKAAKNLERALAANVKQSTNAKP